MGVLETSISSSLSWGNASFTDLIPKYFIDFLSQNPFVMRTLQTLLALSQQLNLIN